MPGWHQRTTELQNSGELQLVGIIQEQHPDRCQLFMQWQQMDWPILVDSLNLLETSLVPIYLLIDEHGVMRKVGARPDDLDAFLATTFEPPADLPETDNFVHLTADTIQAQVADGELGSTQAFALGDRAFRLHQVEPIADEAHRLLDLSIQLYEHALQGDLAEDRRGMLRFRLGVAYRARYDSDHGAPSDFQHAIDYWLAARQTDPNQYIWRRRVQQYGPRLDKPYPFYDWVAQARQEIADRGETPVPLLVEPRGSELAGGARQFEVAEVPDAPHPDPEARIIRDEGEFIDLQTVAVPHTDTDRGGSTFRIHLNFRPIEERDAHWNNEAEPMLVWIEPADGWEISDRRFVIPNAEEVSSRELRSIEFEARRGEESAAESITGFALYNVCEGIDGVCVYRRLDFTITPAGRSTEEETALSGRE